MCISHAFLAIRIVITVFAPDLGLIFSTMFIFEKMFFRPSTSLSSEKKCLVRPRICLSLVECLVMPSNFGQNDNSINVLNK